MTHEEAMQVLCNHPVVGVRFNVVRRPLSGGKGNIVPHKPTKGTKCRKCKGTGTQDYHGQPIACAKCHGAGRTGAKPAETDEAFYNRLRSDYISADPDYWFFRIRAEVSDRDVQVFRDTCLDPILENLCWWYDVTTYGGTTPRKHEADLFHRYGVPPASWRTPFGVWSALEEGGSTEYDHYMETGSEAGLRRTHTLFEELQSDLQ